MNHIRKHLDRPACLLASIFMVEGLSQKDFDDLEPEYITSFKNNPESTAASTARIAKWGHRMKTTWLHGQLEYIKYPLNLSGRGILTVEFKAGGGHAVAFRDGLIFDSDRSEPMMFEQWARSCNPFRVVGIVRPQRSDTIRMVMG